VLDEWAAVGDLVFRMSRARNIKPGFFKNDLLAELRPEYRLLFIGLWCEADREGRLEFRPKKLRANIFPYDPDVDVSDGIAELHDRGFVSVYEVNGVEYLQIANWSKHQNPHHKEVASEIPALEGHVDTVCMSYVPLNNAIRSRIYARDGRSCKQCAATHGLSIDHIIPVSKGGNSVDDNLQVLCLSCNSRKGNKINAASLHDSSKSLGRAVDDSSESLVAPLIPDSPSLIPDSQKLGPHAAFSQETPASDATPTEAGRACQMLRAAGCCRVNPSNPALLAALAEGVTPQALVDTYRESPDKTNPFAWAITTARNRHAEGAKPVSTGPPRSPNGKPSIAQQFANKSYKGTPDEQLPAYLRPDAA
jgi:hypothetical protein